MLLLTTPAPNPKGKSFALLNTSSLLSNLKTLITGPNIYSLAIVILS